MIEFLSKLNQHRNKEIYNKIRPCSVNGKNVFIDIQLAYINVARCPTA